ncbi:MAG: Cof-type HAD-IIB family hydrolase [Bacilli bacterium]
MNYLIAIDSDGTLRDSNGSISSRTKKIVKKLSSNNVIVVCTARPRYHTLKISTELESKDFLISSNGTEIYDNKNSKIIWASYLNNNHCKKIFDYSIKNNIRIMYVIDNTEYVTQYTRNDNQILLNKNNFNKILAGKVKQIMVIGNDKEKIKKFKEVIIEEFSINVIDSSDEEKDEIWFSIVSNESSKGIALLKLADYLNISYEKIIAIGNDKNDISMLDIAKISVAVSNATEETKKHALIITDSNDNDGVAKFLETL